jgi:hypothetical protein
MTILEWIKGIAESTSTTEQDGSRMQNLLRTVGFPNAKVALGIVYLDGKGTMANPPRSLQAIAKSLATSGESKEVNA